MKIYASNNLKFENLQKDENFPKSVSCESFLEFYLFYNCFHLKFPWSKMQTLRMNIFEQFRLKWVVFCIFDQKLFSDKLYI